MVLQNTKGNPAVFLYPLDQRHIDKFEDFSMVQMTGQARWPVKPSHYNWSKDLFESG